MSIDGIPIAIIRILFVILILFYVGIKLYLYLFNSFKKKYLKYFYIRKMFFDNNKKDKRPFKFAIQEYLGIKLEEKEIEYIINNENFYLISKNINLAYSKIKFDDNKYQLKHPIFDKIFSIIFYILTVLPTLFYISFIPEIKKGLNELFTPTTIIFLILFGFLSILSIINLNKYGAARYICNKV
jgi:hypothetical protein